MKYRIRQLRQDNGWTLQHLADLAGTTRGFLSDIETGKRQPSTTMLDAIAASLGVPVPQLVEAETPKEEAALKHLDMFLDLSDEDRAAVTHLTRKLAQKGA